MDMKTKPIDEATVEELRIYAQMIGLEIDGTENRNVVLGKMKKGGFTPERIAIYEKAVEVSDREGGGGNTKVENGKKMFKINIAKMPGVGGDRPVGPRVNGKYFLIPRGKDVWVPEEFVEALRNAVQFEYEPSINGIGEPRETLSYPFSHVA